MTLHNKSQKCDFSIKSKEDLTIYTSLSDEPARREQLKTLGAIMGCDAVVFTASKIKRFVETDPQYCMERRIRKSYGPLRRSLRLFFEQGFIRKRSKAKRIAYEVENWNKLEEYYHDLLWMLDVSSIAVRSDFVKGPHSETTGR